MRASLAVPILLAILLSAGCSRLPRIIVLEDPLTAAEHVELGVSYERKGELDLAKREYEASLRKDGTGFQARVNLGNLHLGKKEYGKAREEYLRALALRPGDPEALNNLSWASIYLGEGIDEALSGMEAVAAGPEGRRPEILDTLGVLRMHANRPGPAEEAFALAEKICAGEVAASGEGGRVSPPCSEEVRREIAGHLRELRKRSLLPSPATNR